MSDLETEIEQILYAIGRSGSPKREAQMLLTTLRARGFDAPLPGTREITSDDVARVYNAARRDQRHDGQLAETRAAMESVFTGGVPVQGKSHWACCKSKRELEARIADLEAENRKFREDCIAQLAQRADSGAEVSDEEVHEIQTASRAGDWAQPEIRKRLNALLAARRGAAQQPAFVLTQEQAKALDASEERDWARPEREIHIAQALRFAVNPETDPRNARGVSNAPLKSILAEMRRRSGSYDAVNDLDIYADRIEALAATPAPEQRNDAEYDRGWAEGRCDLLQKQEELRNAVSTPAPEQHNEECDGCAGCGRHVSSHDGPVPEQQPAAGEWSEDEMRQALAAVYNWNERFKDGPHTNMWPELDAILARPAPRAEQSEYQRGLDDAEEAVMRDYSSRDAMSQAIDLLRQAAYEQHRLTAPAAIEPLSEAFEPNDEERKTLAWAINLLDDLEHQYEARVLVGLRDRFPRPAAPAVKGESVDDVLARMKDSDGSLAAWAKLIEAARAREVK